SRGARMRQRLPRSVKTLAHSRWRLSRSVPRTGSRDSPDRDDTFERSNSGDETRAQTQQELTMAKAKQPNILVIWGDDIGISNLSCYTQGLMGYRTPNIDRIAREGMLFTDSYGEQSCTAGRSSFITGQSVLRTGLSKVGIPAAPIGMNEK